MNRSNKTKTTNKRGKYTRIEAAKILNKDYNFYEVKSNTVQTTYKKIYFDPHFKAWRLIGFAHDYSLFNL